MYKFTNIENCIFVILAMLILLMVVILVMRIHYRKILMIKNRALVRHIREQSKLEKENETITIENAVLHKSLEKAMKGEK